jgi:hypothetical protein
MNRSITAVLWFLMVSFSMRGMLDPNKLWYAAVGMTYADWCVQQPQNRDHKKHITYGNQSVAKEVKSALSTQKTTKDDKHA